MTPHKPLALGMTPLEKTRLERVEQFIDRLKMGSFLAKAAGEGGKVIGNRQTLEPGEQDLARSVTDGNDPLAALQRRVRELESLVRTLMENPAGKPNPVAQGEAVLAKAVSSFHDGESLLAYADTVISDPTVMGVVSSYVSAGDFRAAQNAVLEATERNTVAKAAGDMAQVVEAGTDADLASYDARATASELTARFGKVEQLLASLEVRLGQLEARPQAAAVDDDQQVMAKASGGRKRKRTPEETAAYLHAQIDAYVDSPTTAGMLSSKIQAGQFAEARSILNGAKRAHESAKISAERKRF